MIRKSIGIQIAVLDTSYWKNLATCSDRQVIQKKYWKNHGFTISHRKSSAKSRNYSEKSAFAEWIGLQVADEDFQMGKVGQ